MKFIIMSNSNPTQAIWKGKFSYNPEEYGVMEDVDFELYVELSNGTFEGKAYDDEFRDLYDGLANVKGFIEHDRIHFVVTYPVSYSMDENDEVKIDTTKEGHNVIYNGYLNHTSGKWEGEWEILEEEPIEGSTDVYQFHSTGGWEMNR